MRLTKRTHVYDVLINHESTRIGICGIAKAFEQRCNSMNKHNLLKEYNILCTDARPIALYSLVLYAYTCGIGFIPHIHACI